MTSRWQRAQSRRARLSKLPQQISTGTRGTLAWVNLQPLVDPPPSKCSTIDLTVHFRKILGRSDSSGIILITPLWTPGYADETFDLTIRFLYCYSASQTHAFGSLRVLPAHYAERA